MSEAAGDRNAAQPEPTEAAAASAEAETVEEPKLSNTKESAQIDPKARFQSQSLPTVDSAVRGSAGNEGDPNVISASNTFPAEGEVRSSNLQDAAAALANDSAAATAEKLVSEAEKEPSSPVPMEVETEVTSAPEMEREEPEVVYTHACFLCERKFTSLEHLHMHHAKSKLHKSNVKKEKKRRRHLKKKEEEMKKKRKKERKRRKFVADDDDGDDNDGDETPKRRKVDADNAYDDEMSRATNSESGTEPNKAELRRQPSRSRKKQLQQEDGTEEELEDDEGKPKQVQVWRCPTCSADFAIYNDALLCQHNTLQDRQEGRHSNHKKKAKPLKTQPPRRTAPRRNAPRSKRNNTTATVFTKQEFEPPFILNVIDERDVFSPLHGFLRDMVEVFVVQNNRDAVKLTPKNMDPLKPGDVGMRCKLCKGRCFFPSCIDDIYQKVRRVPLDHVQECEAATADIRRQFYDAQNEVVRQVNIREHYKINAEKLGLFNLMEDYSRRGVGLKGISPALINANPSGDSDDTDSTVITAGEDEEEEDEDEVSPEKGEGKGSSNQGGKSGKSPKGRPCSIPGCPKQWQHNCDGMCMRHYRESKESSAKKSDSDPEGRSDRGKKGQKICTVKGCDKVQQSHCNRMCRRHFSTWKREQESSSDDEDAESEQPLLTELLSKEERSSLSNHRLKMLQQMQLCYLTEKEISKTGSRKLLPHGLPGVHCRHCGKYKVFAQTPRVLFSRLSPGALHSHFVSECDHIHHRIKGHLLKLHEQEESTSHATQGVPRELRVDIWKRMIDRAVTEKHLKKKESKKLLKEQAEGQHTS